MPESSGKRTPGPDEAAGAGREPVLEDVLVLALVDRVWQAGEAWGRAGLLVEEAGVEVGRWALERLG